MGWQCAEFYALFTCGTELSSTFRFLLKRTEDSVCSVDPFQRRSLCNKLLAGGRFCLSLPWGSSGGLPQHLSCSSVPKGLGTLW